MAIPSKIKVKLEFHDHMIGQTSCVSAPSGTSSVFKKATLRVLKNTKLII